MTVRRAFIAIAVTANVHLSSGAAFYGPGNESKYPHGRDERPWNTGENP